MSAPAEQLIKQSAAHILQSVAALRDRKSPARGSHSYAQNLVAAAALLELALSSPTFATPLTKWLPQLSTCLKIVQQASSTSRTEV